MIKTIKNLIKNYYNNQIDYEIELTFTINEVVAGLFLIGLIIK
jgi:hypothetical protein